MIGNGFTITTETVFDLIKSVYQSADAYASDFEQEYPSLEALEARLGDIRKRPGSLFLVASDGKELSGFLFIVPRTASRLRHTADLNMGVSEKARGRGLGGELLGAALSQLRADGIIEIVYLMVGKDNLPAMRLYTRYGFEEIATLALDTKIGTQCYDGALMKIRVPIDAKTEPVEMDK
ncbi:MAG TPA: GNAT family N-acetyltransferase [Smithella sp.]|nr:GNAT family N-acetyltransferase [Smithella sp.]